MLLLISEGVWSQNYYFSSNGAIFGNMGHSLKLKWSLNMLPPQNKSLLCHASLPPPPFYKLKLKQTILDKK